MHTASRPCLISSSSDRGSGVAVHYIERERAPCVQYTTASCSARTKVLYETRRRAREADGQRQRSQWGACWHAASGRGSAGSGGGSTAYAALSCFVPIRLQTRDRVNSLRYTYHKAVRRPRVVSPRIPYVSISVRYTHVDGSVCLASPKIMLLVLLSHVSVTIYMHLRLNALLPVRGPLAAHTNHHRHHAACRFAASHARPRAPRAARALRRVAWGLGRRVYTHKKSHTYQRFAAHQFTPTTHHLPSNCCCIRAHLASPSSTVALLIRKVTVGTSVCCCVKGPAVLGGSSAGVRLSSLLAPALG